MFKRCRVVSWGVCACLSSVYQFIVQDFRTKAYSSSWRDLDVPVADRHGSFLQMVHQAADIMGVIMASFIHTNQEPA